MTSLMTIGHGEEMPANLRVGPVLKANGRSFVVRCSVMRGDMPAFGALTRAVSTSGVAVQQPEAESVCVDEEGS